MRAVAEGGQAAASRGGGSQGGRSGVRTEQGARERRRDTVGEEVSGLRDAASEERSQGRGEWSQERRM